MDELQINKLIQSYKKKQIREKANYDAKKDMVSFKEANQIKSKAYHENNKDKIKERYINNKDVMNARSLYNYYKRTNKLNVFIEKHKVKYDLLIDHGLIVSG
tara:strand:+ start:770 stop:1075 length:306 start_codon:yes stop_codon:yes gene_type:complete